METTNIEAVQASMPTNSALIEYAHYQQLGSNGSGSRWRPYRYAAALLFPKGDPYWIDLGEAAKIEKLCHQLRYALVNPGNEEQARKIARDLDEMVLHPIRQKLNGRTELLLSPDGELNLTPFAALIDEGGHFAAEGYQLTYLTSGRDLLRWRQPAPSRQPPFILANPLFVRFAAVTSPPTANTRSWAATLATYLSNLSTDPLPGTAEEAASLKNLLNVEPLEGDQATIATLERVTGPRILHIATHGFFIPNIPWGLLGLKPAGENVLESAGVPVSSLGDDPLCRPSKIKKRKKVDTQFGGPVPLGGDDIVTCRPAKIKKKKVTSRTHELGDGVSRLGPPPQQDPMADSRTVLYIGGNGGIGLTGRAQQDPMAVSRAVLDIQDPMQRSGLVLSDGIITADKIANLDLRGTQLVTLSACDTGVGETHNSEGVVGLRRALVLSGARANLTTLWQVNDQRTRQFMVAFYKLLLKGEGRASALQAVQREMIRRGLEPYYWAPFIMSGDPGPLGE